jgi:hypothetical protein
VSVNIGPSRLEMDRVRDKKREWSKRGKGSHEGCVAIGACRGFGEGAWAGSGRRRKSHTFRLQ